MKLIVKDRLLIPKDGLPLSAIEKRYNITIFNEPTCAKCEVFRDGDRDIENESCSSCPALVAAYKLYKDADTHWAVPQGDLRGLTKVLTKKGIDFSVKDHRKSVPFNNPIKFTGKLFGEGAVDEHGIVRANQQLIIDKWLRHKDGMLVLPPRTGKTVLACYAACELQQKTIVFVHQAELARQFYNTFMGSKSDNRKAMTDAPRIAKRTGHRVVHIAKTWKDLENLDDVDVLILNYQKMQYDLKRIEKYLNDKFSFAIVDECHNSAAESYLRVVASLNLKHRMPLSATPSRKDGRHRMTNIIMGCLAAKASSSSLFPTIVVRQVKSAPQAPYKVWRYAQAWIEKSNDVMEEVVDTVFRAYDKGHKVQIIPVVGLAHQSLLIKAINRRCKDRGIEELAVAFNAKSDRVNVLRRVDTEPTVLVTIRKMLKEGVDLRNPSCMHILIPMSANATVGAPAFYQLSTRIATPANKPQPVVYLYSYDINMFRSCLLSLFWHEIMKNRNRGGYEGRYHVNEATIDKIKAIGSRKITKSTNLPAYGGWV